MSPQKSEEGVMIKFCELRKGRSSGSQMFFKIDALKYFTNFKGKHLFWSLVLIKLQAFKL